MEKDPEDDILSRKNFQKASGVNFDSFLVLNDITPEQTQESVEVEDIDVAVGQVADIFTRGDQSVNENEEPELDTVTEYAVEGEKRVHYGLMISMIVVWSAIGTIVGTSPFFSNTISALGLFAMAGFGIWLGEIWIPNNRMRILGVTWVIISMKLLYGLVISMYSWEWVSQT